MHFTDRTDPGKRLAHALEAYAGQPAVVYALPRGGVPVAAEAVRTLAKEADAVVTCGKPEAFLGAIGAHYDRFEQLTDDQVSRRVTSRARA